MTEEQAREPIRRQAIVVVHGQGQQRPMGTIRDFVKALWTDDAEVTPVPPNGRDTWIVPDESIGLYELQRITTPPHDDGRRTDFFELYYADLLADTPIRNLWRWLLRLLWIDPAEITERMRWPWRVFWALSILATALIIFVVLQVPALLRGTWYEALLDPRSWPGVAAIGVALVVLVVPKFISVPGFRAVPRLLIIAVIAGGLVYIYWATPVVLAAVAFGGLAYLASNFLLPLFGDAASYLSAQTETVRSRQAIRERGLRLLQQLHDDDKYDRVVIIAHSLGTVLGYDLLQLLWHGSGPTKENPPSPEAVAALDRVMRFRAAGAEWTVAEVEAYQGLQWAAFEALRRQRPETGQVGKMGWKVSDFVSLGSPLASAQFLITEGRADFERLKDERVLPTAPPQPRSATEGFLASEGGGPAVTHHASVFSTVRWTNVYDPFAPVLFWLGDAIGGPLARRELFGPAIRDVEVRITRGGRRLFSHSHYWIDADEEVTGKPSATAPPQVAALRKAVGMSR